MRKIFEILINLIITLKVGLFVSLLISVVSFFIAKKLGFWAWIIAIIIFIIGAIASAILKILKSDLVNGR